MTGREHELVAVGMLGAAVVVTEAAQFGAGKMRDHIERRIGQRPAKVAGLRVVAKPHERHTRHEAHVFHALTVALQRRSGDRRHTHLESASFL
jgi:hypothetical protein